MIIILKDGEHLYGSLFEEGPGLSWEGLTSVCSQTPE